MRRIKEHKENGLYRVKFNLAKSQPLANKFDVLINFRKMATHSSILACRIPQTEEPSRLQFMGSQSQTRMKQLAHTHTHTHTHTPSNLN